MIGDSKRNLPAIDQVCRAPVPRAQDIPDFGLRLGDDPTRSIATFLSVNHPPILLQDGIAQALGFEEVRVATRAGSHGGSGLHRGQGASHRVAEVGLADLRMAANAGGIPHVFHAGPSIGVGRGRDDLAIVAVP